MRWGGGAGAGRDRIRERLIRRAGLELPTGLDERSMSTATGDRTFAVAWSADRSGPLLLVLHGGGGTGLGIAAGTGLATRGPAAGFTTVFPDGINHVWNDSRDAPALRRRRGVDDVGFLTAVVRCLDDERGASGTVYLTGISNGSLLAESIARARRLPVAGLGLVAGSGTAVSRRSAPVPGQGARVVAFAGTADPLVPYDGGPITLPAPLRRRRPRRTGERGVAAPAEAVAADWAAANRCDPTPTRRPVGTGGPLPVTRVSWSAAGRDRVELYRIDGGGHAWPGGVQYLPERLVGPVAPLDATGILLDAFAGS